MKRFFIFIIMIMVTIGAHAAEEAFPQRNYISHNPKVTKLINSDPYNNFAYQMLRLSQDGQDNQFRADASNLWAELKGKNITKNDLKIELKNLVDNYSSLGYLNQHFLEQAESLGLKSKDIWEKSAATFGSGLTRLLQVGVIGVIVVAVVIMPVAAAVVIPTPLKGSFQDSCTDIKSTTFTSSDRQITGSFINVEAKCSYDRVDHGMKYNSIILPEGGPCGYLHNNNGTLVATDSAYFSSFYSKPLEKMGCPELKGSFTRTCGDVKSSPYSSTDSRIPSGSICEYRVSDCIKLDKSKSYQNTLRIPSAQVECQGSRLENCNGDLVIRKAGESDSQCDKRFKSEL